jgi:hypothetical protein
MGGSRMRVWGGMSILNVTKRSLREGTRGGEKEAEGGRRWMDVHAGQHGFDIVVPDFVVEISPQLLLVNVIFDIFTANHHIRCTRVGPLATPKGAGNLSLFVGNNSPANIPLSKPALVLVFPNGAMR